MLPTSVFLQVYTYFYRFWLLLVKIYLRLNKNTMKPATLKYAKSPAATTRFIQKIIANFQHKVLTLLQNHGIVACNKEVYRLTEAKYFIISKRFDDDHL